MKKRIVCVLLTLIMLLSLVPMGASAATREVSEAAITVLKQMTTRATQCYHYSGSEFRTGYGTVCEEEHHFKYDAANRQNIPDNSVLNEDGTIANIHPITEKNADLALRKALMAFDEKVNTFASANGLSLKQNQHDALVVFSYNAGTGWMNGNGNLKSVIINKGSANELLNAMVLWSKESGNGNTTDLSRREVEVNMYVNGIYSNTPPSNYGYVKYNPNGGSMPQVGFLEADRDKGLYTYRYDLYKEMDHPVVPTRNGYKFLGWYRTDGEIVAWVPVLSSDCDEDTLVARWQKNSTTYINAESVNYLMHRNHLSSSQVYRQVNAENASDSLTKEFAEYREDHDNMFWVDRDYIDAKGTRWTHLRDIGGWVKVGAATDNDSFTDSTGTVIATATVTYNGYLNLRQDAGTDAPIIGALAKNDTVNIYEIKTVNGHQWGRSKSGWLCLTYTRVILKEDVSISDAGARIYGFTGVVKGVIADKNDEKLFVHVEAGENTNIVKYNVPNPSYTGAKDSTEEKYIPDDLYIPEGTKVTLTNLFVVNNSETWAKATWTNPEKDWKSSDPKDGLKDIKVTRSGWVKLVPQPADAYVVLDPVTYTVVADSVSVRNGWGDAYNLIMSLNKGVQVQADLVALVGENVWGRITVKDPNHVDDGKIGYVNLASKYFSRDDAPTIEESDTLKNLVATVIGTDSLKVRKTGASYGQQIGTLKRGVTVAVWESNDKGWYKVDSNRNGEYDYSGDGWCSEKYLDIHEETISNTVTDNNGNSYTTDGSGKGIVANTYSGVNVRTGPGTAYATNGKLLPGTVVEILETKNGGKWGRVTQGWISMDYVTMISYNEVIPEDAPNGGSYVESFDKADKTTTTAVYTGKMAANAEVLRNPTVNAKNKEFIRDAVAGENVTIYELAKVTEVVHSDDEVTGNVTTNTTVTTTTYWARINDGWVENPEDCLQLHALDEKVHTQTSVEKLNVRKGTDSQANESGEVFDILVKGDQVTVTALDIIGDKVWGRIDTNEGTGWIRLDYMSEGEVYVKAPVAQPPVNNVLNNLGQTSSVGGFVNNTSGYRYTGKVIRTNTLNVRANPSDTASKTTTLGNGQAMVIYETNTIDGMAWGRCDAGWVYLYYVDLVPAGSSAIDARIVYNEGTAVYDSANNGNVIGTYSKMTIIDIYEQVGSWVRTESGWVHTDNLL